MYLTRTYAYSLYRYLVLIPVYEIVPPENPYRRPHASDTTPFSFYPVVITLLRLVAQLKFSS